LCERFYQTDESVQLGQVGSGIGLSLVKDIVGLHEGTVEVASDSESGVTFTVQLPRPKDPTSQPVEKAPPSLGLANVVIEDLIALKDEPRVVSKIDTFAEDEKPTVLVVDDHAAIRTLVRRRLEPMYQVVEALDGADGLEKVNRLLPDLVISDVMMPVMDGFELCTSIKANHDTSFIPVILLTARAERKDRITGWDTGADAYLAKPFDHAELMSIVVNQIASTHQLKERVREQIEASSQRDFPIDERPVGIPSPEDLLKSTFMEVIAARYIDENFSVDEMAMALGMSRSTFFRKVESVFGRSPSAVLRTFRLEKAAFMFATNEGTVSEICYATGFKNVAHFSKSFREQFGVTPSKYSRGEREV